MKKIEVFDPAMCCSTGVCGTDVDPKLVQFASDLSWLQGQGVSVERFNLSQQPAAFAANEKVRATLKEQGTECLPMIVADGEIVMKSVYPTREQLTLLAGAKLSFSSAPAASTCCGGESEASKRSQSSCCGGDSSKSSCC
ncbi:MAG: hypothetical protein B9S32_15190 [Verrucomicrobia bacterium Tous-C9LFEB]|nr:MAG: hypothetical protein B9S32_15190 [Verrucomicrobia bacterium Tous-C9LFEB]